LVEAYPDYGTDNHLPPYGWRWGNRGALTSGAIEKPHASGWRPILEAEFDLAYTPLMELDYGKGRLVWCALDLEDYVPTDPAAQLLAQRIVEYAAKAPLSPRFSSVAYLGDAAGASQLEAVGVTFKKSTRLPAPDGLAVIGAGASVDNAALQRFVEQGGRVLVLAQESEQGRLGVRLKKTSEAGRGTRPPAWPEARGLSVSDLHSRAPLTGWVIDGGAESGFGGLIGRKAMGKGVAVFAQIAPERLDVKSEPYLRFTRWRQTRALSQLLTNLGASFKVDDAMPGLRSVAGSVALSGEWRMKALKLVPGTTDINNKTPFEPISAQASALVGVDVKDNNWERVKVPGMWPLLDGQDGELVARRQVTIPAEWAGQDLTLSLGAVDDFDTTFWNGEKIGEGEGWNKPRTYTVPGRLVKAGVNVLSVRVFDWYMGGGFGAKSPAEVFVRPANSDVSKSRRYYHPDYIVDFVLGDDPYRYWRW
jgi:beta-galactosidase